MESCGYRTSRLQLQPHTSIEALARDCMVVFALDSSNWLPATTEPRCALERLAREIFLQHAPDG